MNGRVIWITGLSGAGKSTLAEEFAKKFRQNIGLIVHLDGDKLRAVFGALEESSNSFTRGSRLSIAMQYSKLCKLISEQDMPVVISTISMFEEIYDWNRKNLKNYYEVFLDIPLEILKKRDPKNLYSRFDRGEIKNISGLDLEIDIPSNPDWLIKFDDDKKSPKLAEELINRVMIGKT